MQLTPQQLRDRADAIEAHEAGRPVEFYNYDEWVPSCMSPGEWRFDILYRPAPAPEPPRFWDCAADLAELGPVIWIRDPEVPRLVLSISDTGISFNVGSQVSEFEWSRTDRMEYSTDRKAWKPCHKAP